MLVELPCEKCGEGNHVQDWYADQNESVTESDCEHCNERKAAAWDKLVQEINSANKCMMSKKKRQQLIGSHAERLRLELESDDGKSE